MGRRLRHRDLQCRNQCERRFSPHQQRGGTGGFRGQCPGPHPARRATGFRAFGVGLSALSRRARLRREQSGARRLRGRAGALSSQRADFGDAGLSWPNENRASRQILRAVHAARWCGARKSGARRRQSGGATTAPRFSRLSGPSLPPRSRPVRPNARRCVAPLVSSGACARFQSGVRRSRRQIEAGASPASI